MRVRAYSSRGFSFFAWYPGNSSPPAILGDLLANMFNVVGFSWEASPAATELETIVLGEPGGAAFRRYHSRPLHVQGSIYLISFGMMPKRVFTVKKHPRVLL